MYKSGTSPRNVYHSVLWITSRSGTITTITIYENKPRSWDSVILEKVEPKQRQTAVNVSSYRIVTLQVWFQLTTFCMWISSGEPQCEPFKPCRGLSVLKHFVCHRTILPSVIWRTGTTFVETMLGFHTDTYPFATEGWTWSPKVPSNAYSSFSVIPALVPSLGQSPSWHSCSPRTLQQLFSQPYTAAAHATTPGAVHTAPGRHQCVTCFSLWHDTQPKFVCTEFPITHSHHPTRTLLLACALWDSTCLGPCWART